MTRLALALAVASLVSTAVRPIGAQDTGSAHYMQTPDGKVDKEKCALCHEENMTLSRSKAETCTLCHPATPHSGAAEHMRKEPAEVARLLASTPGLTLPLTEDGHIYCGTCHLFHDPLVRKEAWLTTGFIPDTTGLPEAVRGGLATRWEEIAKKYDASEPGAKFAAKGTRQLRLPVNDGSLCRRCHGDLLK